MTADTVGRVQRRSPCRSRRGRSSPRANRSRITAAALRRRAKVEKTSPSRPRTSSSGSRTTTLPGIRTRPTGKVSARSPRCALARSPAVRRERIVCSSSSEIEPFSPNSSRPFAEPGSYTPSRSAIRQPRSAQTSRSGYQSEQLRASRVTSIDSTMPISPRPTRAARSLKPSRPMREAPLRPRSASITSTSAACQPRSRARPVSAYCSRRLSWLLTTCAGVD